jgi:hypothetical protein
MKKLVTEGIGYKFKDDATFLSDAGGDLRSIWTEEALDFEPQLIKGYLMILRSPE